MNLKESIQQANKSYIAYQQACDTLAMAAQKYIDWDDDVCCQYFSSDGLCILVTLPEKYSRLDLLECVCPVEVFFEAVKAGKSISPAEFKSMSI